MPGKPKQKKTGYTGYAARFVPKTRPRTWPKPKPPRVSTGRAKTLSTIYKRGAKTLTKIYNRPGVIRPRAQMVLRRLTKRRGGSGGARKR